MPVAASQHLASPPPSGNPYPPPQAALDDVERTVAFWRADGLTAAIAWKALGGAARQEIEWSHVKTRMVRIAAGRTKPEPKTPRLKMAPRRSAMWVSGSFGDCPRAVRDFGSPRSAYHGALA